MREISIVIVGGGTAGWITANVLLRRLMQGAHCQLNVTLVESKRIGILGVGEATVPTIRTMLRLLGVSEREFIAATGATFKHGILYRGWAREADLHQGVDTYFHPFELTNTPDFNPALWWLTHRVGDPGSRYSSDIGSQERIALAGKAPRHAGLPPFEGLLGYAYHLDAERLAEFLSDLGVSRGARRLYDEVIGVERRGDGTVAAIRTREHGAIEGDFFIDCTGFAGMLVNKTLGVGFVDYGDVLFCDRAVALRVPTAPAEPIRPYTTTTAKDSGWIWEIDLQRRKGAGYVYSSRHASPEQAESDLRKHIGAPAEGLDARHLNMRVGRSEKFWVQNVAAIGLSGGFIEPLESTGIYLIEVGALRLAEALQSVLGLAGQVDGSDDPKSSPVSPQYRAAIEPLARNYNAFMTRLYEEIRDFIKIHYSLSGRKDTAFWRDNTNAASLPDSLKEMLARWEIRLPLATDFPDRFGLFNEQNWLYVMLGMGWRPRNLKAVQPFVAAEPGRRLMAIANGAVRVALNTLPDHRAYFDSVAAEQRVVESVVLRPST